MSSTTNSPIVSAAVLAPIDVHHKDTDMELSLDVPTSVPSDTITASMKKMHYYAIHVLQSIHAQGKLIDMDPLSLDILLLHSFDPKHIQLLLKKDKKHTKALKIVPSLRENIAGALATDFYQQDTTNIDPPIKIKRKYTKKTVTSPPSSPPTDSLVQDIVQASTTATTLKKARKPRVKTAPVPATTDPDPLAPQAPQDPQDPQAPKIKRKYTKKTTTVPLVSEEVPLVSEEVPLVPPTVLTIKRKYTKKITTEKPVPPVLLPLTEELVAESIPVQEEEPPALPVQQDTPANHQDDEEEEEEEEEPIQGRLISFQDQSYIMDAAQRIYHPTSYLHLGHLDPVSQAIVFL